MKWEERGREREKREREEGLFFTFDGLFRCFVECLWLLLIQLRGFYYLSFDSSWNPFLQNYFLLFRFEFFLFLWIALPILGSGFSRVWRVSAFDFLSPWVCLSFSEKLGLKLILGSRQNKAFYLVFVVLVFVGEMVSWVVCFSVSQTKISWFYTNWIVGEVWCLRFQIPCVVRVLVVKELKLKLLYRLMWGDKLKPFSVCC